MTMHRNATRSAALAALMGASALAGCASEGERSAPPNLDSLGTLSVALTVDGYTVQRVGITIRSADLDPEVVRSRSLDVSDPSATLSAAEYGLPAGTYTVGLAANVADDPSTPADEGAIACEGSLSGIVVTAGAVTQVSDLVLLCTVDGGQVRRAGGLVIEAELDTESINQCPDLVQSLFIGPLETSVNGSVAISAVLAEGASIRWAARGGSFAADGTLYTCPAIAGTYTLQGTITTPSGCREQITRDVSCHGAYAGSCESLPKAFAFEGSCGLRSPCHVTQDGCAWQANCRGQLFSGQGEGASFPFIALDGSECAGSIVDGELVGTCGSGEDVCEFATNSAPPPTTTCDALPRTITNVTACGVTYAACDVIQDACRYQATCDGGAAILNGVVTDDVLQWNFTRDGGNYRCEAPIMDGAVQGSCVQRGVEEPITCNDFAATVPVREGPVCEETLPDQGFVVEGCGLDGFCFPIQRGCAWALRCGTTVYDGVANATNAFEFTSEDGKACTGGVVDGFLTGTCQGEAESCGFAARAAVPDAGCYQTPAELGFVGCGFDFACAFLQDGCDIAIMCNAGELFTAGEATATGITFAGLEGYQCTANTSEQDAALRGQCVDPNGSNAGCETGIVLTPR